MIVGYGFDTNFKKIIKEKIPSIRFVDTPLQDAPTDIRAETKIALVFVFSEVDKQCLETMPNLEKVITLSAGTDHIDFEACKEQAVDVYNTPKYGSRTVAEQAFALLLAFERHIIEIRHEDYDSFDRSPYFSRELNGKTIGVIGTGAIGEATIKVAKGFNMNILAYDVKVNTDIVDSVDYVSLKQLCTHSDYVSLHVPLNKHTKHLLSEDLLQDMRKDAVLINTSRAGVVDEDVLVDLLKEEELRGAVLDVFSDKNYKVLKALSNTILTPHNAFYTRNALENMAEQAKALVI